MENKTKKADILQFVKFALFSASAGIIQLGSFTLMKEVILKLAFFQNAMQSNPTFGRIMENEYGPIYLIALLLSVIWNFTFNRKFTFKSASNIPVAMLKVLGYYAVFTPVSTVVGNFFTAKYASFAAIEYIVLAITMITNMLTEFIFDKFVVFREPKNENNSEKEEFSQVGIMTPEGLVTLCGTIKGIDCGDYYEYRGIEYAKAKRWEYPVLTEKWEGVLDATKFGACSYQKRGFEDDAKCSAFYHKEFREGMTFSYSEDCLFLNIYAPKNKGKCPVLIYIHGGSFTGGSADEGHIDGKAYAERGIIFVALNYRLGPYGFCSHPDLKNEDGICGNYGLYDQFAAIEWIKKNISAFGGDSENMTLLGQSAGAMSVDIQLSNPMAEGWYKGAVLMSGAALQRGIAKPQTPEKSKKFWDKVIELAGCKDINELREVDVKTLYYAWLDAQKTVKTGMLFTLPVYDGKLLVKGNFSMDTIPDLPYIIGVTKNDMVPAVLEILAKKWAKKCVTNSNMCYTYNFMRSLPGDDLGAWHSADLPYAFATLEKNWRPFEYIDYKISNQMVESISAFVRTQDPNCDAIPTWTTDKPLHFCEYTRSDSWKTKELIHNTISNKGPM